MAFLRVLDNSRGRISIVEDAPFTASEHVPEEVEVAIGTIRNRIYLTWLRVPLVTNTEIPESEFNVLSTFTRVCDTRKALLRSPDITVFPVPVVWVLPFVLTSKNKFGLPNMLPFASDSSKHARTFVAPTMAS